MWPGHLSKGNQMANTRETMGEQACLDALVADTLTSFEDDGVTKVGSNSLLYHDALTSVMLPQCKTVNTSGFTNCINLEVVDMLGGGAIGYDAFSGDKKLAHLLLRGESKTTLFSTNSFTSTPISLGNGAIYVPSDLLATYKADTNWKNYFITTLDKYPLSSFDTITESWAELDSMTQAQIEAKYAVGDTKLIDLGIEGKVYAQIAGFGLDDLTSGSKAKVTFVTKNILATTKRMNPPMSSNTQGTGAYGGWKYSEMRTYLNDTVLALLPSELQSAVKSVTKYSGNIVSGESTVTKDGCVTQDKLWIPSHREVFGESTYEENGPVYSGLFPNQNSRIKYNQSGSVGGWWLRSANTTGGFRCVYGTGIAGSYNSDGANGVVIGFCI